MISTPEHGSIRTLGFHLTSKKKKDKKNPLPVEKNKKKCLSELLVLPPRKKMPIKFSLYQLSSTSIDLTCFESLFFSFLFNLLGLLLLLLSSVKRLHSRRMCHHQFPISFIHLFTVWSIRSLNHRPNWATNSFLLTNRLPNVVNDVIYCPPGLQPKRIKMPSLRGHVKTGKPSPRRNLFF